MTILPGGIFRAIRLRLRFCQALLHSGHLAFGIGWRSRIRAKVLLYAEMNRQNYGYDGPGAKHQHHKKSFYCHKKTGYQNENRTM